MIRALLLASILLTAFSAAAATECTVNLFSIDPIRPTTDDVIRVHVRGGCPSSCHPYSPRVELTATGVTVHFSGDAGACLAVPTAYGERVEIGRLPAGTRDIVLMWGARELGRTPVTVTSPPIRVQPRFGTAGTSVLLTVRGGVSAEIPKQVIIGGVSVAFRFIDVDSVLAFLPQHAPGLLDVTIDYGATAVTAPQAFDYTSSPDPSYFTKVLFPLTFSGPGAFGSQWRTESSILNRGTFHIATDAILGDPIGPGQRFTLPSHDTNRGFVAGVPRDLVNLMWFASHVRDLSRNAEDAGTELPVVTEDDTRSRVVINGLKFDPKYRYLLRIYDIDGTPRRVFVVIPGVVGLSVDLHRQLQCIDPPCNTHEPAFGVLDLSGHLTALHATDAGIEIIAAENDARIWAFISATNNETQHVTTYSPQR